MSIRKKNSDNDDAIARIYSEMQAVDSHSPEAKALVHQLKELELIKSAKRSNRPSADTWLIVGGTLAQVLVIVAYEHSHVLVSKAFGIITKTSKT